MGTKPELWEGNLTYTQDSDCCQSDGLSQNITIRSQDSGSGTFFVIETERWAFDDPKELVALLNEAAKRLGVEQDWVAAPGLLAGSLVEEK